MAEVAGLAFAVPGVLDVIVRSAAIVYEKIDTFKHIDDTTADLRELTLDLKEGVLYFGLMTLKSVYFDKSVTPKLRARLVRGLKSVKAALSDAERSLSYVHSDRLAGKLRYAVWRGEGSKSRLDKRFQQLKDSCDDLRNLCLQLHQHRAAESCYLLTSDFFKIRHETSNDASRITLPESDIFIATANYTSHGQRVSRDFLVETKARENDVRFLSAKLNKESLEGVRVTDRVLPVLGYRQPPYNRPDGTKVFQLVVGIPSTLDRASLAHLLCTERSPTPLERLELCQKLARSLQAVHTLGLVHKSVRSRSILMLFTKGDSPPSGQPYLQDWTYIREISDATTQLGEMQWSKRMYQHPERQGEYAESAFEPKHDIYCLGVCMLEVLLWIPFVRDGVGPDTARLQICRLFEQYAFAREEQNGGLPPRYQGDPVKLTSRPWITMTVWQDIASAELEAGEVTQLIKRCFDGTFVVVGDVEDALQALVSARKP